MSPLKTVLGLALTTSITVAGLSVALIPPAGAADLCTPMTTPVYHRYNPSTQQTLLTISKDEATRSINNGYREDHGIAFRVARVANTGLTATTWLRRNSNGDQIFLNSTKEAANAVNNYQYVNLGTAFYTSTSQLPCTIAVSRYQLAGRHRYATTSGEGAALAAAGWTKEASTFYAARPATTVTPTPTVIPTPPPAPPTFVIGQTKPSASNTGPAAIGITSLAASGDVSTTAAGQTITGKNIAGFVNVRHNDTTVRGNIVRGRNAGSYVQSALVKVAPGVTGTVIEYNDIYQYVTIGYWQNGVSGSDYTARRNNIHDVVDMFAIDNGGATIEANYLHGYAFHSNDKDHATDSYHPYWTHNDGVQIKGGTNSRITGNTIDMYASSTTGTKDAPTAYNYGAGITAAPDKSVIANLTITSNWLAGGEVGFQANKFYAGATSANLGIIGTNRVSKDQHYYPIRYKNGYTVTGGTTNYWDPNAPSVPAALAGTALSTATGGGIHIDS